jgi:hypothetical protein
VRNTLRGLHRGNVDGIQVGSLLAVNLDGDEMLVENRGGGRVFEGFALHDVAPVAGGVPDGEEDRLVLVPGPLERLLGPGVPVDRVVRVLPEVGARLAGEVVPR